MRIRGTSVKELEEAGEDTDGVVENTSKLYSKIKSLTAVGGKEGISILGDDGKYLNTYEILSQIAERWEEITAMGNDAALLELIAGKTRGSVVAALLQQPEVLKDAYQDALNAEGSALAENEKYLDSIQGRIDLFNNSVQTMWSNTLDSDLVKIIVDLGTGLIKIVDNLGLVRTLLFGIGTYLSVFKKDGGLDWLELFGIQDKQGKFIIGQQGLTGWVKKITESLMEKNMLKRLGKKQRSFGSLEPDFRLDNENESLPGSQELQGKLGLLREQYNQAKEKLTALETELEPFAITNATRDSAINNITIPEGQEYDIYRQNKQAYFTKVFLPQKSKQKQELITTIGDYERQIKELQGQIDATPVTIPTITKDANANATIADITENTHKNIQDATEQLRSEISDNPITIPEVQSGSNTPTSMLEASSQFSKMKLEMPQMSETDLAGVMDTINAKTSEGQGALLQYFSTLGDGNEALQAYIASLNGGQASLTGFNNFIQTHNAGLKASGTSAKLASIGHAALNTALSMGLSILIQFVMEGLSKFVETVSDTINPTKKLAEQLSNLTEEISKTESNMDSLDEKLDTCRDRMAELSSLPSLSFVEQEELGNLEKEIALLERKLALEEALLAGQEQQFVAESKQYIDTAWNKKGKYYVDSEGIIQDDSGWKGFWHKSYTTTDILEKSMARYQERATGIGQAENVLLNWDSMEHEDKESAMKSMGYVVDDTNSNAYMAPFDKTIFKEYIDDAKTKNREVAASIEAVFADQSYSGLSYGMSTEIDTFLDEFYAYQDKWNVLLGTASKSDSITSLFDKTSTDEMQQLGKNLQAIADNEELTIEQQQNGIKEVLNSLDLESDAYKRLKTVMETVGVTAQDISDYFTLETGIYNSDTIDGITNQYAQATNVMRTLQGMGSQNTFAIDGVEFKWDDFFSTDDAGKLQARADKFGEILKGMDKNTREVFMSLSEQVMNNDDFSWDDAIKSLNISGLIEASKLIEEQFSELNKSVFKGLDDEISGFIDTFSELGTTLEDVASSIDLLKTAEQQMRNSGRLSIKTTLELIESTDRWNEILTIENGTVMLNANAEDVLVQSKINTIKANIQEALSAAKLQLAQLGTANATLVSAEASDVTTEAYAIYTDAMNQYSASIAGFGAAIGALLSGDFLNIGNAFRSAYDAAITVKNHEATVAGEDLTQKIADLEAQAKLMEQIDTSSDFEDYYDFEKTPGDKYDSDGNGLDDDAEDELSEKFQNDMDYWENRISASQAKYEQVQNEIDLLEQKGQRASADHYKTQITLEDERRELLESQREEAQRYLEYLEEIGQKGSDEWWNVAETLNGIEAELDNITANVWDLYDAIAQVNKELYEETHARLSNITTDLENIRDVLSYEDMFDEEGDFTEAGVANLATYVDEIARYKEGINEVKNELTDLGMTNNNGSIMDWNKFYTENTKHLNLVNSGIDISKAYQGNESYYKTYGINNLDDYNAFAAFLSRGITSEQEFYDELTRLTDKQNDYTKGIKASEKAVIEMYENQIDAIEEYTNKLVNNYNDYIDGVKKALDAERELYEFKKNIEKQTKNIATLERRIASLSGSTAAEDVAERRRLEAQLLEEKESLNDSYYSNAKDAQMNALDEEAQAYEETMNRFIEGLRDKLQEATTDITTFITDITGNVVANADVVYKQYTDTGLALDSTLVQPWKEASDYIDKFGGSGGALEKMNSWTAPGGVFDIFQGNATEQLKNVWGSGELAVGSFGDKVSSTMTTMSKNIRSNVANSVKELQKLNTEIGKIKTTDVKTKQSSGVSTVLNQGDVSLTGGSDKDNSTNKFDLNVQKLQHALNLFVGANLTADGIMGAKTKAAIIQAQKKVQVDDDGIYGSGTKAAIISYLDNLLKLSKEDGSYEYKAEVKSIKSAFQKTKPIAYAKGTMGTTRDEFAITDEPWLGDELVLVPTASGNLSYMRKGTSVVPAEITENLVEWGKMNPNMMSAGVSGANLNMISNAVNKPEFNIEVENFLRCDNVSKDSMPELKRFVNEQMNNLMKQMNYSLKRFSR